MGLWGSFVVGRAAVPLPELTAVAERSEGIEDHQSYADGWQVGQYPGPELAHDAAALLTEVAAETGAPALTGFVLDSDTIVVEGYSEPHGYWRACLVRHAMQGYCEDDGEDFDAVYPTPEQATGAALRWAGDAGLTPDPDAVRETFQVEQVDLFAEGLFFELLHALGIRAASAAQPS